MSGFYPQLFEDANFKAPALSKTGPNQAMLKILSNDPAFKDAKGRQKYSYTGNGMKIKNNFRVIVEPDFIADIDKAFEILQKEYNLNLVNIEGPNIVPATTPGKYKKYYSSKYTAYEYSIQAEVQDKKGNIVEKEYNPIIIIPTQPEGEKASETPTELKEGMVNYFFTYGDNFQPLTTSNAKADKKQEVYEESLSRIIKDIRSKGIPGLNKNDTTIILNFLAMEKTYNVKLVHTINNALAIGKWLKTSRYGSWEIRRGDFFNNLKLTIAHGLGFPKREIDKWNPMDLMMIRPGSEGEIKKRTAAALAEEDENLKLGAINSMFVDEIDSNNENSIILGVSLKEGKAQAGKATSYFNKPLPTDDISKKHVEKNIEEDSDEYKLTKEEYKWPKEKFYQEIISFRKEILAKLSGKLDEFNYKVGNIEGFDQTKNYYSKYGSLKLFNHILERAEYEENIFTNIVRYGLSLSKNPTFFKFIGNEKGNPEEVGKHIEAYPPNAGLQLYNKKTGDFDGKILVNDGNKNSGLEVKYAIEFTGDIYDVKLSIRSNQGTKPGVQVVVEIQRWAKSDDLNEEIFYPQLF